VEFCAGKVGSTTGPDILGMNLLVAGSVVSASASDVAAACILGPSPLSVDGFDVDLD